MAAAKSKPGARPANGANTTSARGPGAGRRLATRIAAIFLAGALIVILHFTGTLDRIQRHLLPHSVNWNNDYAVVEHLRDQVVQDGLTHDRPDCLLFIINGNDPPSAQRIQVMEKHNSACPGAPGQLPRLFTLRVDRSKGLVESDQGSPGQFHPLQD